MPRDYVRNRPSSRKNQQRSHAGIVWLLAGVFIGLIIAGVFYVKNHPSSSFSSEKNISALPSTAVTNNGKEKNVTLASTTNKKESPREGKQNVLTNTPAAVSPPPSPTGNTASKNLQTQFDFYDVLPGKNVTGPAGEEDESAVKPAAQPASSPQPQGASASSTVNAKATAGNSLPTPLLQNNASNTDQNKESDTADIKSDNDEGALSDEIGMTSPDEVKSAHQKPLSTVAPTREEAKPKGYVLQLGTFSQYADADKLKAQLVLLGFDVKSTSYAKNGKNFTRIWLGPFHTQDEAASVNDQLKENNISAKLLKSSP